MPRRWSPFSYWAPPGNGWVAADQITDAQVLVSQLPAKVRKFFVFMFTHWHSACPGFAGSASQTASRHCTHRPSSLQVITRVLLVTACREKFECRCRPAGARCSQVLKPTE